MSCHILLSLVMLTLGPTHPDPFKRFACLRHPIRIWYQRIRMYPKACWSYLHCFVLGPSVPLTYTTSKLHVGCKNWALKPKTYINNHKHTVIGTSKLVFNKWRVSESLHIFYSILFALFVCHPFRDTHVCFLLSRHPCLWVSLLRSFRRLVSYGKFMFVFFLRSRSFHKNKHVFREVELLG